MQKSWFSDKSIFLQKKNCQKTSSKFSQSLVPECTVSDDTNEKLRPNKTRIIKIYPDQQQTIALKNLLGIYRFLYNKTVSHIRDIPRETVYLEEPGSYVKINDEFVYVGKNKGNYKVSSKFIPRFTMVNNKEVRINQTSLQTMRPSIRSDLPEWTNLVMKHTIDCAIIETSKNFSNVANKIKETGKFHSLDFKKKRKLIVETVPIEKAMFSKNKPNCFMDTLFKNFDCGTRIKSNQTFGRPQFDVTLSFHRKTGDWFLHIPYYKKKDETKKDETKKDETKKDICSIDPGEKCFLTTYSPEGEIASICTDLRKSKMFYLLRKMDELITKMKTAEYKRRSSMSKAINRLRTKIKNMKKDLHWKSIKFLTDNEDAPGPKNGNRV